jgi:voltage-gated potassium channel Kch
VIIWTIAVVSGVAAVGLAAWGWSLELPRDGEPSNYRIVDIATRAVKVLLLSDIYFGQTQSEEAGRIFEIARALGIASSVLVATRLFVITLGRRTAEMWFRFLLSKHDVIIGEGPGAAEYAAAYFAMFGPKRKALRLAVREAPRVGRVLTLVRAGGLDAQLNLSAARRARRIVVDEGDDSDTWQTAHAISRALPEAEVVAHITDPWVLDRLNRDEPRFGLVPFSYSTGAARQVLLAHPPYLIARRFKAKAQHILIVGFGQVGQAVAREFLVTSVHPEPDQMMVTVVDPEAEDRRKDFTGRHPELGNHADFAFITGDFRDNDPAMLEQLAKRFEASEPCGVYLAIDDNERPLSLAFAIRTVALQRQMFRAPVFICAQHGAGLSEVKQGIGLVGIETDGEERYQAENRAMASGQLCDLRVVSFGEWHQAFDGAGLLEPQLDGQARRFHETLHALTARLAATAVPPKPAPPEQPWQTLPDPSRTINRRAVAHIRAKAHAAGFDLNKWLETETAGRRVHDLPPAADKFRNDDPAFRVRMGELEHRRWMFERLLDGWRKGPADRMRDRYAKTHPNLVPYAELDAASRAKDDNVVAITMEMLDPALAAAPRKD